MEDDKTTSDSEAKDEVTELARTQKRSVGSRTGVSQIKALKSAAGVSPDCGSEKIHKQSSVSFKDPPAQRQQRERKWSEQTDSSKGSVAESSKDKISWSKNPLDFARFWFNRLLNVGSDQTNTSIFGLCDDLEDLEMQFTRSRPPSLSYMLKKHPEFSTEEMKTLYRGFKQSCSNGVLTEETLEEIFGQIFQIGDSAEFSQLVFATLDHDNDGEVIFEEFVDTLSSLTRRGIEDKLEWIFNLYDIDQDGTITEQELLLVLRALYSMSSSTNRSDTSQQELQISEHLGFLYEKFISSAPTVDEGFVTMTDFKDICLKDHSIVQQITALTAVV